MPQQETQTEKQVERYGVGVRIVHGLHTLSFLVLFITGLVLMLPPGEAAWLHTVHVIAARVFITVPVLYFILRPRTTLRGLAAAFRWGRDDRNWLKGAFRYYGLGEETALPPQGFLNAGQKLWWLMTIITWLLLSVSGLIKELGVQSLEPGLLTAMTRMHDICFVIAGALFLLHLYLALFHPVTSKALMSMISGRVPADYAARHHGRWYQGK